MKKILIIPDSFKGSLSAVEVCTILEKAVRNVFKESCITLIPASDGGEGICEAFMSANKIMSSQLSANSYSFIKKNCSTYDPYFNKITADYLIGKSKKKKIAIIESASAIGLSLISQKDPTKTTSYGLGKIILDAIDEKCSEIFIGLGGSCTNDGGAGMASALGIEFFDSRENSFVPTGGALSKIKKIDLQKLLENKQLLKIKFIGMCDVQNPLYGKNGASLVYAPQKGATIETAQFLDSELKYFSNFISKEFKKININYSMPKNQGAGAAGGLGFALTNFLNAKLKSGIEVFLDFINFETILHDTDLILTGEGQIDDQTEQGKLIYGILRRTQKKCPVIAFAGNIKPPLIRLKKLGLTEAICISPKTDALEDCIKNAKQNLVNTAIEKLKQIKEK